MDHDQDQTVEDLKLHAAFPKILECVIRMAFSVGDFSKIANSAGIGHEAEKQYITYYWKLGEAMVERLGVPELQKCEAVLAKLTEEEMYEVSVGDPEEAKKTLAAKDIDWLDINPTLTFIGEYRSTLAEAA